VSLGAVPAMSTFPAAPPDKAALRAAAVARRDRVSAAERAAAAAAVTRHVDGLLVKLAPGATVALYAAMRSEMPTRGIEDAAVARGLTTVYPRVVAGQRVLRFFQARADQLVQATFGIPEPPGDALEVEPARLALVVVPALLFDRDGGRLGWGKGHYDATLPLAPRALRVGVGYEHQRVDHVPQLPHDQPVHLVVTEAAVHPGAPGPVPWTS